MASYSSSRRWSNAWTTPTQRAMAELHSLLADGCDSPLYNSEIHVSELRATLYWVRARLVMHT